MKLSDGTTVYALKDRYDSGYAGFGYGGDNLYVTALVDVFDPPRYLIRADSFEAAYDVAVECLVETVSDAEIAMELEDENWKSRDDEAIWKNLEDAGFTLSPTGRIIWAENDIRLIHLAGPERI